jgi:hypothetical protein
MEPDRANEDVKRVVTELHRWLLEAKDFRNDGWVQQGYKDKLMHAHAVTTTAMQVLGLITNISKESSN